MYTTYISWKIYVLKKRLYRNIYIYFFFSRYLLLITNLKLEWKHKQQGIASVTKKCAEIRRSAESHTTFLIVYIYICYVWMSMVCIPLVFERNSIVSYFNSRYLLPKMRGRKSNKHQPFGGFSLLLLCIVCGTILYWTRSRSSIDKQIFPNNRMCISIIQITPKRTPAHSQGRERKRMQ